MIRSVVLLLLAASLGAAARAGEIPTAVIVLDVAPPALPDQVAEALPPRFVLLEDGQVFVGGTRDLVTARLDKSDLDAIDDQVARVRKLVGLGAAVTLGPGPRRYRLQLRKNHPLETVASGDPAAAPAALRPLADLLQTLSQFHHPALRPYRPTHYELSARPGTLAGGCRSWTFEPALAEAQSAPRMVTDAAAAGWPTGATPASVCDGDKRYVVTLKPLLPGEKP